MLHFSTFFVNFVYRKHCVSSVSHNKTSCKYNHNYAKQKSGV